jgi:hypothetical protein
MRRDRERAVGDVVLDAHGEAADGLVSREIVIDGEHLAHVRVLRAEAVTTPADQADHPAVAAQAVQKSW